MPCHLAPVRSRSPFVNDLTSGFTSVLGDRRGAVHDPLMHHDAAVRFREVERLQALLAAGKFSEPLRTLGYLIYEATPDSDDSDMDGAALRALRRSCEDALFALTWERWAQPSQELLTALGQVPLTANDFLRDLEEQGLTMVLDDGQASIISAAADIREHVDREARNLLVVVLADRTLKTPLVVLRGALGEQRYKTFTSKLTNGSKSTAIEKVLGLQNLDWTHWQRVWELALTGVRVNSLGSQEERQSALQSALLECGTVEHEVA